MQREPFAGLITGWVVPTGLRSTVVRCARRAALVVDAWLEGVVLDRADLEEVADRLGTTPRELQARALRTYLKAIGLGPVVDSPPRREGERAGRLDMHRAIIGAMMGGPR